METLSALLLMVKELTHHQGPLLLTWFIFNPGMDM